MDVTHPDRLTSMPSIASVMTACPQCVDGDDSLLLARAVMQRHEVRHLPVKHGDVLLGVLTDRDIKRAMDPELGLPPQDELFVRDVFIPDAYVVDGREPLDTVLDHMGAHHIGSVLITEDGRLAGIFTVTDACRAFCRFLRATVDAQR